MGNRLSSRTISGISSSLRSTAAVATSRLANQGRTAASLARSTNIGGSYANSFASYIRNGTNGAIRAVSDLTGQMRKTSDLIAKACSQFERSASGVVDEGAINSMCAKLSAMGQDISGLQGEIDAALSAASKYISPVPVKLNSVSAAYTKVISGLKKIVSDLHRLNSTINGYANLFYGGIGNVNSLLGAIGGCYSGGRLNLNSLTSYISGNPTINQLIGGGKKLLGGAYDLGSKVWKTVNDNVKFSFSGGKIGLKIGNVASVHIDTNNPINSSLNVHGGGANFNLNKSGAKLDYGGAKFSWDKNGINAKYGVAEFNIDKSGAKLQVGGAFVQVGKDRSVTFDTGRIHYSGDDFLRMLGQDPNDAFHQQHMDAHYDIDFRISGSTSSKNRSFTIENNLFANSEENLNWKFTTAKDKNVTSSSGGSKSSGLPFNYKLNSFSGRKTGDSKYTWGYHVADSTISAKSGSNSMEINHVGKFGEQKHGPYDIFNGKPYSLIGWLDRADSQRVAASGGGGGGVF